MRALGALRAPPRPRRRGVSGAEKIGQGPIGAEDVLAQPGGHAPVHVHEQGRRGALRQVGLQEPAQVLGEPLVLQPVGLCVRVGAALGSQAEEA